MDAEPLPPQEVAGGGADQTMMMEDDEGNHKRSFDETMEISDEEILSAWAIKVAVQETAAAAVNDDDDSNDNQVVEALSDFEYVQYALCTEDETQEKRLERMIALEAFRQNYRIHDTVSEGVELIEALSGLQPGFILQIDKIHPENIVCLVVHWGAFDPTKIITPQHVRIFLGALYYTLQCRMCNFHSIRSGARIMGECGGAGLRNFNERLMMTMVHELYRWYPQNHEKTFFFNTPAVTNFFFGLWKRYMSHSHKQSLHLGYQIPGFEGCQIDSLYKTPTPEAAQQRMVWNAERLLQERYLNQNTFVLPE